MRGTDNFAESATHRHFIYKRKCFKSKEKRTGKGVPMWENKRKWEKNERTGRHFYILGISIRKAALISRLSTMPHLYLRLKMKEKWTLLFLKAYREPCKRRKKNVKEKGVLLHNDVLY